MNIESIKALLTSPLVTGGLARAVTKLALVVGGGATTISSDRTTQVVSGIVTLVLFVVELYQSRIAHQRALMTPPPV